MHEQKREMDMLKETNINLMQKLETQQGQLDALEKKINTQEEDAKRMLNTPLMGTGASKREQTQGRRHT